MTWRKDTIVGLIGSSVNMSVAFFHESHLYYTLTKTKLLR